VAGEGLAMDLDLSIYPMDVVLRTCHTFTARCYVFVHPAENGRVTVELAPRDEQGLPRDLAGQFSNALVDYRLRALIAEETRPIRELLVAQAFCEADLLDRRESESDEQTDPRGIAG
jgi:His-Xaa-Ser system protein HxsD